MKKTILICIVCFVFILSTGFIYAKVNTRAVIKSIVDANQNITGREYLSAFHKKIMSGTEAKIVFSGDSTTSGLIFYGGESTTSGVSTNGPFRLDKLITSYAKKDGIDNLITTVNRGQTGKNTQQWVDSYLQGDLAENPNLLVIRWGINDPAFDKDGNNALPGEAGDKTRRSAEDFKKSLRDGLAKIRSSKNLSQLSIVLMTPNTTSDSENRRDQYWDEEINPIIRQAAKDFQCMFIDTYSLYSDSEHSADYLDTLMPGELHLHPQNVMNIWISSAIYDNILPSGFIKLYGNKVK